MYRTNALIIFLIIINSLKLSAQDNQIYTKADSVTYEMYMSKKWDKLIDYYDNYVTEKTDSYFTSVRVGIAYYEKKEYMNAISHFEKALNYKKGDEFVAEYLYYSYLYSGRESDANLLIENYPADFRKKIKYRKPSFIKGIYTESGYTVNSDYNTQKTYLPPFMPVPPLYMTQVITKNFYYVNINLLHSLGNRVSLFQGYTHYSYNYLNQFVVPFNADKEFSLKSKQDDYYINLSGNLGKGFGICGAFHYLHISGDNINIRFDALSSPVYSDTTFSNSDIIFSLALEKVYKDVKLLANSSYSNLNNGRQFRNGITVTYFPFANLNLYGSFSINLNSVKREYDSVSTNNFIFEPFVGFKAFKNLWVEAYYTFGDIYSYHENNAFVVFNNLDKITQRAGVNLIMPFANNKVELSFRYQYLKQQQTYFIYFNNTDFITSINNISNHKLIGGIKWSF
jgi:hypothetical protein